MKTEMDASLTVPPNRFASTQTRALEAIQKGQSCFTPVTCIWGIWPPKLISGDCLPKRTLRAAAI
ncbi:hypothetical protein D3C87_2068350 [compost metagenome]